MGEYKVFIDGRAGTTGLRIDDVLAKREDITLLSIPHEMRKDENKRLSLMEEADITFLCLPDIESKNICEKASNNTRIIDASTAHRTNPEWAYGLPEIATNQRNLIKESNRVAIPGCHASGFILIVRALIDAGIVSNDFPFAAHSITGFSGGGHNMIDEYEGERQEGEDLLKGPRQYALTQSHKHLPEMVKHSKINITPIFIPHVSDFYEGLEVVVPLHKCQLNKGYSADDIREVFNTAYAGEQFIKVRQKGYDPEKGFLSAAAFSNRNDLEIVVTGSEERIVITARYDNLGKGACGAGIQCMNIMLGIEEGKGLL